MSFVPGLGIAKGMALTMRRFFAPKATIQYPETAPDIAVRFRGRLQLLYDELGNLKCETCFQCAAACPVECIDMGGFDTKGRFHVHWGAAEQYAERREESALRRAGRPVPDPAYTHFDAIDTAPIDAILEEYDWDQAQMLAILAAIQDVYGYLPVAALKKVSQVSGAPYALIYGRATYYSHLRFEKSDHTVAVCRCTACLMAGASRIARSLGGALGTEIGRPPAGGVALEQLPAHIPGAASPLVTLDGKPQPRFTATAAAALGRTLAGGTVA
ncbi:MAG TPA: NAD(P)H-dependent oxidoreductase subunit E [Candidatus Limnocylindrales bacterium]|jgi:NADH:ubiquinone oxidoreductase 24 kD subunit|nr:NAD(P)H-dependent oxidoreductase subunit E [Candidatus Limnocylindrales bacterium]